MTVTAWLIEKGDSQPCCPLYYHRQVGFKPEWTVNHDEAKKFESTAAAAEYAGIYQLKEIRICEHGWD